MQPPGPCQSQNGGGGWGQEAACASSLKTPPPQAPGRAAGARGVSTPSGRWGGAEGLSWNEPSEAPRARLRWITVIILPLLLFSRELINAGCISLLSQVSFPPEIREDV